MRADLKDLDTRCEGISEGWTPPTEEEQYQKVLMFFAMLRISDLYSAFIAINILYMPTWRLLICGASFMFIWLMDYVAFIPYLTLPVSTFVYSARSITISLAVIGFYHIAVSGIVYVLLHDEVSQFSTFIGTFWQVLYIMLKVIPGWDPVDHLDAPLRPWVQFCLGVYAFYMLYVMMAIWIASMLVAYARVIPAFKNTLLDNIRGIWRHFREKVLNVSESKIALRYTTVKNLACMLEVESSRTTQTTTSTRSTLALQQARLIWRTSRSHSRLAP